MDKSVNNSEQARESALCSMDPSRPLEPWPVLGSQVVGDYKIFTLKSTRKRSPRTGAEVTYYALDTVDWVNIVALTPEHEVVMVEQFRHGTNTVELELPGGMMDRGESDPVAAACRELREETGYEGENARRIGCCFANPAILTNRAHTVLVERCIRKHELEWDSGEDIRLRLVPAAQIPARVAEGKIRHSIIVAALYYYDLWKKQPPHPVNH